jgi:predicted metal-dependent peptidase
MTAALNNFDPQTADKALSKAKIALMSHPDCTFFTHCVLKLVHKWDHTIPTACTNGREIRYNPQFFMGLSPDERVGLILHETLHVVFMHMLRLGERDPGRWNAAADHVINLYILERGFKLPTGGLHDRQYKGMHTEQVYALLPEMPEFPMDLEPAPGDANSDPETANKQLQREIDDMLVSAVLAARKTGDKAGSIPGQVELYVDNLLNPKVPWHRILAAFFTRVVRTGRSFRRPNRRYLDSEIIMPVRRSVGIAHGACATDISGSVSDREYHHYVSETASILRNVRPEYIDFLRFDTRITGCDRITDLEGLKKVKFTGRGGTRIEPILVWARENEPDWLVIFTDGHFNDLQTRPKCPVVWIIHSNPGWKAPFGKTIHINFDK